MVVKIAHWVLRIVGRSLRPEEGTCLSKDNVKGICEVFRFEVAPPTISLLGVNTKGFVDEARPLLMGTLLARPLPAGVSGSTSRSRALLTIGCPSDALESL